MTRVIRKEGEPRVVLTPLDGYPSLAELRAAYPDAPGGIKIIATSGDEIFVAYFEGNSDADFVGRFIASHTYVNAWTCVITSVSFEGE